MPSSAPLVAIVGSINMDLVVRAAHVPSPGETVLGRDFATIPGGKGANQAVAVSQLGAQAVMIGRLGNDDFGKRLRAGLQSRGVDDRHVEATDDAASGIAMIVVADDGENAITVASGANFRVTPADIDAAEDTLRRAKVCLLQLELPVETVVHAIEVCRRHGVDTILDPAPAPAPPIAEGLFRATVVTPNESEAAAMTGLPADADPREVAASLREQGAESVVLKLGRRGAHLFERSGDAAIEGFPVQAVDTTAAGDAFTAALAVARAEKQSPHEAVRFANAAGALACMTLGAQPSMPAREKVEQFLNRFSG